MRYSTYRWLWILGYFAAVAICTALIAAIAGFGWALVFGAVMTVAGAAGLWFRFTLQSAMLDDYGGHAPMGGSMIWDVTDDRPPPDGVVASTPPGPPSGATMESPLAPRSPGGSRPPTYPSPDASGSSTPTPRRTCTHCSATVTEPAARFCDDCGWPLTSPPRAVASPSAPRRCLRCQTAVTRPEAKYCYACGEPLPPPLEAAIP